MVNSQLNLRLPAEWEIQDGILLAWPHEKSDWLPILDKVETVFTEIVSWISMREKVILVVPEKNHIQKKLKDLRLNMKNISFYEIQTNDTWARDFGPITVYENGKPVVQDYIFNAWGMKFAADLDNRITSSLHQSGAFGKNKLRKQGLVLEGGSIESDGKGTILTTAECLLSPNRNPHLSQKDIEEALKNSLGAKQVLWLENGYLAGDDTDSHIDTLARLCPDDTIAYVSCGDKKDEHYSALQKMKKELELFRTIDNKPFRLLPLPWPGTRLDSEGCRLPATYANFLIINGAVLLPTYDDRNDGPARDVLKEAFPGREIISVNCLPLILQHGSLHCVTMQLPKGVLS